MAAAAAAAVVVAVVAAVVMDNSTIAGFNSIFSCREWQHNFHLGSRQVGKGLWSTRRWGPGHVRTHLPTGVSPGFNPTPPQHTSIHPDITRAQT